MEKINCECGVIYKPKSKQMHLNTWRHTLFKWVKYFEHKYNDRLEFLSFKIHEIIDKGDEEDRRCDLPCMQDEYDETKECRDKMVYVHQNIGILPIGTLDVIYRKLRYNSYFKYFTLSIYGRKSAYNNVIDSMHRIIRTIRYQYKNLHIFDMGVVQVSDWIDANKRIIKDN